MDLKLQSVNQKWTQLLLDILHSFPKDLVQLVIEYVKVFKGVFSGYLGKCSEKQIDVRNPSNILFYKERIFITTTENTGVKIFDRNLNYISFLNEPSYTTPPCLLNIYRQNIYLCCTINDIVVINLSDMQYKHLIYTDDRVRDFTIFKSRIYLCDMFHGYIRIYTIYGMYLKTFGHNGPKQENLQYPTSITNDNNFLYVIDSKRILLYDEAGNYHTSWDISNICNSVEFPSHIRINGDFVCFRQNSSIHCLNKHGEHIQSLDINIDSGVGRSNDRFTIHDSKCYICDYDNDLIAIFE